jgi:hypothetical protein
VEAALLALAGWLDAAGVSHWARGGAWVYPVVNSLHLLGLVMLVGSIGVVDLRLAGLWRRLPAAALSRALTPVALCGLALLVASGTLLFAADGAALARSDTFHRKLVLIALALANALLFRLAWQRRVEAGEEMPPLVGRLSAGVSLLLWLAVGTLGRMIAYS